MKKILTIIIVFSILILAAGYWMYTKKQQKLTASVPLISREVLFGNPEKSRVKLSPNGQYISFIAPLNGVLNIFIGKPETLNESAAVTQDTKRGIRQYFWLYDNQHIVYLQDDGGDENWRIHVLNIETKSSQVFTPEKVNAYIYNVSDKFPDEIIIGLNDRDPAYHDVYRLNIRTGEKTLLLKNDQEFRSFLFDDDYKLRFASTTTSDGGTQYFKAIPLDEPLKYNWESFMRYGLEDTYTTGVLGLTRDGHILYVLDSRGKDLNVLKEINLNDHTEHVLAEAKKSEISKILSHPYSGVIQAYREDYLRNEWTYFDDVLHKHMEVIQGTLAGDIDIISRTQDDHHWIVAELKDDGPMGYYLYSTKEEKLTFLFHNSEKLNHLPLAKREGIVIKSRDGLDLTAYITKPLQTKGPVPLVLFVHGGPWARDSWGYNAQAQWLANRGYAVLQVNYRGSTGFGKSFVAKGNLEWGRKMHEDLLDAVQWAIKEGIADASKIAIYGASYGGYASLWAATQPDQVFKCAIDVVGPSNLETLLATFPAYWASFKEIAYRQIGDPRTDEGKALLKERSPLTHVHNIKIPVLIAQGEKDPRVKQAESEQIVNAMKEKKLKYMYMLFKDEGHGFARPENNLAFTAVAEKFLSDNLGGRYEPMTKELDHSTLSSESKKDLKHLLQISK